MPARRDASAVVKTYRYLRIALVGVVVFLSAAIAIEAGRAGCVQTSISAYYYTPVRAVFVGSLMLIGFGLIVLRGSTDTEDVLLNLAGMLAPVVAIIPTTDLGPCGQIAPDPAVVDSINNNVWALLAAGFIGIIATAVIGGVGRSLTRRVGAGLSVAFGVVAGSALLYASAAAWVRAHAHGWSALAMFALLAVVSLRNGRRAPTARAPYRRIYVGIGAAMVVAGGLAFAALSEFSHQIFVLEALEIGLFAVYWSVQTKEHWRDAALP